MDQDLSATKVLQTKFELRLVRYAERKETCLDTTQNRSGAVETKLAKLPSPIFNLRVQTQLPKSHKVFIRIGCQYFANAGKICLKWLTVSVVSPKNRVFVPGFAQKIGIYADETIWSD